MSGKPPLLYLCHRIPYPPNKGDKIRSYHLLCYLVEHYEVYLGTFIDEEQDWQYVDAVRELCAGCEILPLARLPAKIRSLTGLLRGQALSLPFYFKSAMAEWVDHTIATHNIEQAVVFSSAMGQYLMGHHLPSSEVSSISRSRNRAAANRIKRSVMDCVDVDSDKWLQYSTNKPWPLSWLYRREGRKLLMFEQQVLKDFDHCLFVSHAEAEAFREMVPEHRDKVGFYRNGVDSSYFDPELTYTNPYPENTPVLVFTGAMDYWPNVDAVCWFADEVLPGLRAQNERLTFYIVGRNPAPKVAKLSEREGIVVTGGVDDIRPYIKFAATAVAPMRIARGIQNKVLEAMAMATPVLVSQLGLEGIDAELGAEVILADDPRDYLEFIPRLLQGDHPDLGDLARRRILREYSWNASLPIIGRLLNGRESEAVLNHG